VYFQDNHHRHRHMPKRCLMVVVVVVVVDSEKSASGQSGTPRRNVLKQPNELPLYERL